MLSEKQGGEMIKEVGIFNKEMKMYQTYLPAFEKIYKSAGCEHSACPEMSAIR